MSSGGLVLNVYSADSRFKYKQFFEFDTDGKTDLDTAVVYKDAANVSDFLSFQLIDKANGDAVMGGSGPYNVSEIHQFGGSHRPLKIRHH